MVGAVAVEIYGTPEKCLDSISFVGDEGYWG